MATQRPISTISYNSEPFLREKLDMLYKAHKICAYQYIKHVGEDGDKDHIHLRIEPNVRLDSMEIQSILTEYVPDNVKPLCCRPFRPSKEEDWFLYAVHDEEYLRLKYSDSTDGKIPYDWHDIVVSDMYDLECAFVRAKSSLKHSSSSLVKQLKDGSNPVDLLSIGESPFMVNTIMHALQSSDYSRLAEDYKSLTLKYNMVMCAIKRAGFCVVQIDDCTLNLVAESDVPFE